MSRRARNQEARRRGPTAGRGGRRSSPRAARGAAGHGVGRSRRRREGRRKARRGCPRRSRPIPDDFPSCRISECAKSPGISGYLRLSGIVESPSGHLHDANRGAQPLEEGVQTAGARSAGRGPALRARGAARSGLGAGAVAAGPPGNYDGLAGGPGALTRPATMARCPVRRSRLSRATGAARPA